VAIQKELLEDKNKGLREALCTKKKHNKKGKVLDLQQREEYYGGAMIWSPRKLREAQARDKVRRDKEALLIQKAEEKERKATKKALKHQQVEQRKKDRVEKGKRREVEMAEKKAQKERKKQEKNSKKPVKQPQSGERKAPAALAPRAKRVRQFGDEVSGNRWVEAPLAGQPSVLQRGRTTKPRRIFE